MSFYHFLKDERSDYLHQCRTAFCGISLGPGTHNSHVETNAAQLLLINAVLLQNGGKTVLPALRSIKWQERAPADGSLIPFFTSTLRHATFSFAGPPDEWPHVLLLRRLRECSPFLQTIDISTTLWDKDNVDVGPQLLQEVLLFDRLRKVEIFRIKGPATFRNLVAKPSLVSLTICDVTGPWVDLSSQPPPIVVPDLRTLSVSGTGPALAGFFGEAHFLVLESATINLYWWDVPVALRDLVAPLLQASFRELRFFSFGAEELTPRLEDADIKALVSAWPDLEHPSLVCDAPSHSDIISLNALHYIHSHCHKLEKLAVRDIRCPVVGVQAVPELLDRSSPHSLRHMSIDRRPVPPYGYHKVSEEAAAALARYLLELFPVANRERYKPMSDQATTLSSSAYNRIFFERLYIEFLRFERFGCN